VVEGEFALYVLTVAAEVPVYVLLLLFWLLVVVPEDWIFDVCCLYYRYLV
jgi:hypothetical protein